MKKSRKSIFQNLSKRERQIMDVILRNRECSATQVMEELPDPPSYSSVRALLAIMLKKGYLKIRQEGKKYIYYAAEVKENVEKSVLDNLITTFFEGSAPKAISSILNITSSNLTKQDYKELKKIIEEAEKKNK